MKENFEMIYQSTEDIIHQLIGIGDTEKANYIYEKCMEIKRNLIDLQNQI